MKTKEEALKALGIKGTFFDISPIKLGENGNRKHNELVEHKTEALKNLEDLAPQMAEMIVGLVFEQNRNDEEDLIDMAIKIKMLVSSHA